MAHTDIVTGQYVKLQQTPASAGDRLLAQLIDIAIVNIFLLTVFATFFNIDVSFRTYHPWLYYIFGFVVMVLPTVFYHPLCEWLNHGQSVGKAVMKCRVVMADGSTPTLGAYLLRWLLYPIDVFLTGGLGLIVIMFTPGNQRFGDLAAGTMVIKTNSLQNHNISLSDFYYVRQGYQPTFADAANLSLRQLEVIGHVLYDVKLDIRERCLDRLTAKVEEFVGEPKPRTMTREDYLYTVLNDYYYYASVIEA